MPLDDATHIPLPQPPLCAEYPGHAVSAGEEAVINLQDGEKLVGGLREYRPDKGLLALTVPGRKNNRVVKLNDIKSLHLPNLRQWVRAEDAEAGHVDLAEERQDFEIRFRDGERIAGTTLGVRTDRNGVYVFPVQSSGQYMYTFVPYSAMEDYRVGPRLGEMLVDQAMLEESQLEEALERQGERRRRRIGDYLQAKAIVTGIDLEKALEQQKSMPNMKLGEILVSEGLITDEQLESALDMQRQDRKQPLGELLISEGLVTTVDIQQCLAKKLGIPYVDLRKFQIEPDVLSMVPGELARKHSVLPLYVYQGKLVVAVENPMIWEPLDAVRFRTNLNLEPVMASQEDIVRIIDQAYTADGLDKLDLDEFDSGTREEVSVDDEQAVTDNVVVKLVNRIIMGAYHENASDIHIEPYPTQGKTLVRIRRDGSLLRYYEVPAKMRSAIVARVKIMAGLDIAEKRKPQDGKIDFRRFSNLPIELRVATLPTVGGQEDVVMRILAGGEPIPLVQLGLSERNLATLKRLVENPYGLFFVCGPTGSGKTTTLHSVLGYLNTDERKIWTAEDPVEITQKGLRQVQVNPKIGLTFAAAMRAFLRADPDIIMVGEMRDQETTKIGIEASLTGHLVFATLHTNTAPESITRLLDMGMDPFNFADALVGVLSQRLAKRLCPDCKTAYHPETEQVESLLEEYCYELVADCEDEERRQAIKAEVWNDWRTRLAGDTGQFTLYRATGCDECHHTGYRGRIGIHELLEATDTIKRRIVEQAPVSSILEGALHGGMRTLRQDGIEKVLAGHTDMEQVRKVCIK